MSLAPPWHKLEYFFASLAKTILREGRACPSCGHAESTTIDRKYGVTRLVRCGSCGLLYRLPTTREAEYRRFYQNNYAEGFTTELPSTEKLAEMKRQNFAGTEKDYSTYLAVLRALGAAAGDRVLDFGCSWGYGSWQFAQAGFSVKAYEISENRRAFAKRHLGVTVYSSQDEIDGEFDLFFSSHVLEHIPAVSRVIELAGHVLKPGGWFVAFTPNGSSAYRQANPRAWSNAWGFVHPLFLDEVFYQSAFQGRRHLIASSPYDMAEIAAWAKGQESPKTLRLDGSELLVAAQL